MWFRAVVGLFLFSNYISSQTLENEGNNIRVSRQLDFKECCPCPGSTNLADGNSNAVLQNSLPRAEGIDDCPCRSRSADSDGSSSIFYPTAVRSFLRADDGKEESKNLLEPEVGLASSVLETLREVTEEEYQDALTRDAARARAAEESMLKDTEPEESGRSIVTVIVKPKNTVEDDVESDASHVQESRCIHPLGRSLGKVKMSPSNPNYLMDDILRLPKKRPVGLLHRNLLDMDSYGGATNVRERVVDSKGKFLSNSETETNDIENNNILIPSTPIPISRQNNLMADHGDSDCEDLSIAPSNMQERFAEKQNPKLKLKFLTPGDSFTQKKTMPLRNLLKLRDVEFIPLGKSKNDVFLPQLELKPLFSRDRIKSLNLHELFNGLKFNLNKGSVSEKVESPLKTKVLDSIPNTSNISVKETVRDNCEDIKPKNIDNFTEGNDMKATRVIDTIFSPSENNLVQIINNEGVEERVENSELLPNEQHQCKTETSENKLEEKSIPENAINEENIKNANLLGDNNDQSISVTEENFELLDRKGDSNNINKIGIQPEKFLLQKDTPLSIIPDLENQCSQGEKIKDNHKIISTNEELFREDIEMPETMSNNALKSVKESFKRKFEEIKHKSLLHNPTMLRSDDRKEPKDNSLILTSSETNHVSYLVDNPDTENRKDDDSEATNNTGMSIAQLQDLSNSLLKLSNKLEGNETNKEDDQSNLSDFHNEIFESTTIVNTLAVGEVREVEFTTKNSFIKNQQETSCFSTSDSDSNQDIADSENKHKPIMKDNSNEMEVGASEPVLSKILKRPFTIFQGKNNLKNEILEPMSFENPRDVDTSDIFSNLPTIEEINDQLSGIFGTNFGNSDENTSFQIIDKPFCPSNDNEDSESLMAAEPSTINTKSRFAPSGTRSDVLESFRTKFKLPTTLEPHPIGFKSFLSDKSDFKSRLATNPIFAHDSIDLFRGPIDNLANLDHFASTLRDNTQNLLYRGRELIPFNLKKIPSVDSLAENLRSHTENAAKNLQSTVESTFKQTKPNILLSEYSPRPNELLNKIASAREDLNDKLIGLHHDLNDRLTTLHENVFDQSRFMSSRIPVLRPGDRSRTNNVQNLRKTKSKPLKLLTVESRTESIQRNVPEKVRNFVNRIDNTQGNMKDIDTSFRDYKLRSNIPVPKSVEVPRLEQTLRKPPLVLPRRENNMKTNHLENLNLNNIEKTSNNPKYKPLLRKDVNPFKDSKFRITFATTTQAPTTPMIKPGLFTTPSSLSFKMERNGDLYSNRAGSFLTKLKSSDTKVLPSEIQLSRLPAPSTLAKSDSPVLQSRSSKPMQSRQGFINSDEAGVAITSHSDEDEVQEQNDNRMRKPWSAIKWPNKVDNSFFNMKTKKAGDEINKNSGSSRLDRFSGADMAKLGSENNEVALFDKHLKENVTYKCKMVCTRE